MRLSLLERLSERRAKAFVARRLIESGRMSWGRHSYSYPRIRTYDGDTTTRLDVGNFCSIGAETEILLGGNHPLDRLSTFPINRRLKGSVSDDMGFPSSKGNVTIGNDVWIGHGALILSGVSIGHGAVVAARTVVHRDVAPFELVAGSPMQHVKFRFSVEDRDELLDLRWWDWPDADILARAHLINGRCSVTELKASRL
ncbi:CatB-related O-acetyltransferase [Nocardioides nanhaiensis]|uniref:CatB-related O-acetyltransferase n=1 Tax=Nocardioides nanhaiensis TaxID=1476871 RepID=UPI003CD06A43